MIGTKERRFAPLTHVSLEDLVPTDHFYRHLDRTLDLSFVREFVQETYAGGGRPSIDPVVFFKLQLVMFFEGIRSERLLMRHADDRLSVRWYLGYDLDEPLPDHSSLTRIRTRYGVEMFRRFFEAIVDQCQQAGLVWGKELYFDATKVNANASMESVKPRFAVEKHLRELFATEEKAEPEPAADAEPCPTTSEAGTSHPEAISDKMTPTNQVQASPTTVCELTVVAPVPLPVSLQDAVREDLTRSNEQRHDWTLQVGKPDREVIRGTYRRMADFVVSTTDPDATVMLTKGEGRHLGYHTHYVVDGGKARIIMAVLVTPSEVMENQPMRGSASSARASAGNCGRARRQETPPTAPSTTSWHLNMSTSTPTFPCPTLTNGPRSMDSRSSSTIPLRMSIRAQMEPHCAWKRTATPNEPRSIEPMRPPAMPAPSKNTARTACAVGPSDAVSMRNTLSGFAPTIRPSRTKKPCASAASGSSRCLQKAKIGMA
jgi:transposase